jgi:TIR domain
MSANERQVFLCHNSKDKPEVEKVRDCLKDAYEIKTFMDKYDFETFKPWENQLEGEMLSIGAAAIFLSKSGLGPWQAKEIDKFAERVSKQPDFRMGLVILPSCSSELSTGLAKEIKRLGEMHWVDFRQANPDPMAQLVSGIKGSKQISDIPFVENQLLQKANRELRVELFKMYSDRLEDEVTNLHKEIESEKLNIRNLEKAIKDTISNIEEELDPSLKETIKIFSNHMEGVARNACESALKSLPGIRQNPRSSETRKQIICFNTDIDIYIRRIRMAIVTSSCKILNEKFSRTSDLDPSFHVSALDEIRNQIHRIGLLDSCPEIDKYIDYLKIRTNLHR